jgi:hypothetical protein
MSEDSSVSNVHVDVVMMRFKPDYDHHTYSGAHPPGLTGTGGSNWHHVAH